MFLIIVVCFVDVCDHVSMKVNEQNKQKRKREKKNEIFQQKLNKS